MPSSLTNRFFAASIALSEVRADRMMIERWQQRKSFSFRGICVWSPESRGVMPPVATPSCNLQRRPYPDNQPAAAGSMSHAGR
jgi:hypothetical protein